MLRAHRILDFSGWSNVYSNFVLHHLHQESNLTLSWSYAPMPHVPLARKHPLPARVNFIDYCVYALRYIDRGDVRGGLMRLCIYIFGASGIF